MEAYLVAGGMVSLETALLQQLLGSTLTPKHNIVVQVLRGGSDDVNWLRILNILCDLLDLHDALFALGGGVREAQLMTVARADGFGD